MGLSKPSVCHLESNTQGTGEARGTPRRDQPRGREAEGEGAERSSWGSSKEVVWPHQVTMTTATIIITAIMDATTLLRLISASVLRLSGIISLIPHPGGRNITIPISQIRTLRLGEVSNLLKAP